MDFKYSQFNIVNEIEQGVYSFYNTKNRKHLIIKPENEKCSSDYFSDGNSISKLSNSLREKLIQDEFIIHQHSNELKELEKINIQDKNRNYNGLFLTILPTLKCNFRCSYCFENSKAKGTMNKKTKNNLIQFIEFKLLTGIQGKVQVKWFGGEPLLAKNSMLELSEKIKKMAVLFGVDYQASLVTNGFLLDKLTKGEIEELHLSNIQVTLDGPEEIHNKRRPAKNGDNSFEQILKNIEKTAQFFKNIIIRVNIDKENASEIHHLLKFLKQRGVIDIGSQVYFAFVDTEMGRYSMESQCAVGLGSKEVQDIYNIISTNLKKENLESSEPLYYPRFLSIACDAQIENYYVINPEGFVFKCSGDASFPERSLFNLNTKEMNNISREEQFLKFSAIDHLKCRSCRLLPMCQGGCVSKYMDLKKGNGPYCWPFCHIVNERLIKLSARHLKNENVNYKAI